MQIIEHDDDFIPRVSFEKHRSSSRIPFSPLLLIDGLSRKSYNKLPQEPLKLTVLKLDGSTFGVEVTKTATVAELKQAVEHVFSHLPKNGPGKVSWSHVWGHFCLCYGGQKLVIDSEYIRDYEIKDGDQLHFIRHVSINYNLIKRQAKDQGFDLEQSTTSDGYEEREQNGEKDDGCDDQENLKHEQYDDEEDEDRHYAVKFAHLLGGWFPYRRLMSPGRRFEASCFPSRFANGFFGSFRSMVRIYNNKFSSRRDIWKEV
uniref:SNRNP25 ubiquitin-like domain-containing protein n=1 Tax=Davidia involucrata TaxID=16924 RepID=A0A5B7AV90_DAVIN